MRNWLRLTYVPLCAIAIYTLFAMLQTGCVAGSSNGYVDGTYGYSFPFRSLDEGEAVDDSLRTEPQTLPAHSP
jgi:hypothetical protein